MCDVALLARLCPATWLLVLALLGGVGCSGGGSSPVPQVDDPEITQIIKDTKDPKLRRELIGQALLRRGDPAYATAPQPKAKPAKGKTNGRTR